MRYLGIVGFIAVLAGCATAPVEDGYLERATAAIERATDAQAPEHAPLELRFAREKLVAAQAAHDDKDYAAAARLAEQCEINATLAIARSQAAQARKKTRSMRDQNEKLKQDLETESGSK